MELDEGGWSKDILISKVGSGWQARVVIGLAVVGLVVIGFWLPGIVQKVFARRPDRKPVRPAFAIRRRAGMDGR